MDLIGILRPVVNSALSGVEPRGHPELVRKAFKVAESEKPGGTRLELPEEV